jgi:hypothetical protein
MSARDGPDWRACHDVDRHNGQWVVRGTTVPVQAIIDEAWQAQLPTTIAELHGLPVNVVWRIMAFADCFGP